MKSDIPRQRMISTIYWQNFEAEFLSRRALGILWICTLGLPVAVLLVPLFATYALAVCADKVSTATESVYSAIAGTRLVRWYLRPLHRLGADVQFAKYEAIREGRRYDAMRRGRDQ